MPSADGHTAERCGIELFSGDPDGSFRKIFAIMKLYNLKPYKVKSETILTFLSISKIWDILENFRTGTARTRGCRCPA